jgi:hypothetical protein
VYELATYGKQPKLPKRKLLTCRRALARRAFALGLGNANAFVDLRGRHGRRGDCNLHLRRNLQMKQEETSMTDTTEEAKKAAVSGEVDLVELLIKQVSALVRAVADILDPDDPLSTEAILYRNLEVNSRHKAKLAEGFAKMAAEERAKRAAKNTEVAKHLIEEFEKDR